MKKETIKSEIEEKIYLIRGKRVMLDKDLAALYGVKTETLNQAVKRNLKRFPRDFMFRLKKSDLTALGEQNLISHKKCLSKHLIYAFTEEGVAMLPSVLKSKKAVAVNIAIMMVFAKLREVLLSNKEISYKLNELEKKIGENEKEILIVYKAIGEFITEKESKNIEVTGFSPAC